MDAKLNHRIELLDRNTKALQKKYWLKNLRLQVLAGFILCYADREAYIPLLDECRETLRRNFGLFSSARDNLELPIMASMAVSGSPEAYVAKLKGTYEYVRRGTLLPGDFEMLAAMTLMDAPNGKTEEYTDRMKSIYGKMRKNHPWLTDSSDKISASILTLSGRDEDELLGEMEACYMILKEYFKLKNNQVQAMSALLAVQEGTPGEKCAKTVELCEMLKANGMNMNTSLAMPVVAGLAAVEKPTDEIVEGVKEAFDALKGKTGFGAFGLGKEGRVIYGIINYLACCGNDGSAARSLAQSELMNVIIQEIIITMIIITSAQASAWSSNS